MRKLAIIIVSMVVSLGIYAQGMNVTSRLNGPVMLDSIESPNKLFSDVVFDNVVEFKLDFDKMTLIKIDRGEKTVYEIEERYRSYETSEVTSSAFVTTEGIIFTFTLHHSTEENPFYVTVQETIEYMEYQVNGHPWYVHMYYVPKKDVRNL